MNYYYSFPRFTDAYQSNVLIDEHGNACLCDFGHSQVRAHTTAISDPSNTSSKHGSPRWMAPEQMSLGILNKTTDIYSFGMTVYEVSDYLLTCISRTEMVLQIFTGTPPFAKIPDNRLISVVVDCGKRPQRPYEHSIALRGLDDTLWKLVEDCWAQDSTDRPVVNAVVRRLDDLKPRVPGVSSTGPEVFSAITDGASLVIPLDKYSSIGVRESILTHSPASPPTAGDDISLSNISHVTPSTPEILSLSVLGKDHSLNPSSESILNR
jgi:serine/threonine protein kinase